jgi:hypothetical protein
MAPASQENFSHFSSESISKYSLRPVPTAARDGNDGCKRK